MKIGYLGIGTENQCIIEYSLHQRLTDTRCLKPHLENVKADLGKLPKTIIADAGYGGEENYEYLEGGQLESVVKYSTYHKDKSKKWQQDISKLDYWHYVEAEDTWMCAVRRKLLFCYKSKGMTESGYDVRKRHYRSEGCKDCPLKEACTKAQGNRENCVSLQVFALQATSTRQTQE